VTESSSFLHLARVAHGAASNMDERLATCDALSKIGTALELDTDAQCVLVAAQAEAHALRTLEAAQLHFDALISSTLKMGGLGGS
jgi:hypothetical protein